jgi:hypothetical protein
VLGLPTGPDRADVTEAFRRFALRHHPDRGGDSPAFQAGLDAYRQLLADSAPRGRQPPAPADVVFHRRPRAGVRSVLRVAGRRLSASFSRP